MVDLVQENDGIFHHSYCAANGGCDSIKSLKPCSTKLPHGQGFSIIFEGITTNNPWTIRTGETIIPNHRGEYHTSVCAANLIDPFHINLLRVHSAYKEGHLLYEGGLADQPAIIVEAIGVIESEIARVREREQEKKKTKSSNKGRR